MDERRAARAGRIVLYVAGYGRSGSTVVDRVLGAHPEMLSAGEISTALRHLFAESSCGCGEEVEACPIWGPVRRAVPELADAARRDELDAARDRAERIGAIGAAEAYADLTGRVLDALFDSGARVVIDSSKTAWRQARRPALLASLGFDVRVLHLVRDPRGCVWSLKRGDNLKLEARASDVALQAPVLRGIVGWTAANAAAAAAGLSLPHLRVRYEDFVSDTEAVLDRIGELVGLDMAVVKAALASGDVPPAHQLAGNRMRLDRRVRLKLDEEWRSRLGAGERTAVTALTLPLLAWYRYPVTSGG
jgi:hypothetical protein